MAQETIIPGMMGGSPSSNSLYSREPQTSQEKTPAAPMPTVPSKAQNDTKTPVVGFLYSVSNSGLTEYWLLHLGTNTIGRSDSCDIVLREGSVSEKHATLSIKQLRTTGQIIASIQDTGSKNGVMINDDELDYEMHSCKNNDVLTVGIAYKLLLVLINPAEQGLSISKEFVPVESIDPVPEPEPVNSTVSLNSANIDAGATTVM